MMQNQSKDKVGDTLSQPLAPQVAGLRNAVDQADSLMAEPSKPFRSQSSVAGVAKAIRAKPTSTASCTQVVWISFFFDGTGNNMEADIGSYKHSNIAKLYLAHKENSDEEGIYSLYIPGIGTYFKDVGDPGGTKLGMGTGDYGQARLSYALEKFDEFLKLHHSLANSSANSLIEVNIAAFGFSRGAALARAFVNQLLEAKCKKTLDSKFQLKTSGCPVRVRFMGLFDTVASVGLPLSSNSTSKIGTLVNSVKYMLWSRSNDFPILPRVLAFRKGGLPGADPNPGRFNGHLRWGGQLSIPEVVEDVRHFVAGHEIRNSFPLDSVSTLKNGKLGKPTHFTESVYPGAHSDVGGSYRPGEGGKSLVRDNKLGLIPLGHMYSCALSKGVPLRHDPSTVGDDFHPSKEAVALYNHYNSKIGTASSLGDLFNRHMSLYFAWRFRAIRRKERGDVSEAGRINNVNDIFLPEAASLRKEIADREKTFRTKDIAFEALKAKKALLLNTTTGERSQLDRIAKVKLELLDSQFERDAAEDKLFKAKARLTALPDMTEFAPMVDLYDSHLLEDTISIRKEFRRTTRAGSYDDPAVVATLRPHYRILVEAYENEYLHNRGMTDEKLIAFFDSYIHDSLSGFATDATLPSDPRVIYLGGNDKYAYADIQSVEKKEHLIA